MPKLGEGAKIKEDADPFCVPEKLPGVETMAEESDIPKGSTGDTKTAYHNTTSNNTIKTNIPTGTKYFFMKIKSI
jgi:hypothetical protein